MGQSKEIDDKMKKECVENGYRKGKYWFFKSISETRIFVLGLGNTTYRGARGRNAMIGVVFVEIEKLRKYLRNPVASVNVLPTVSIQLGYLMPEHRYKEWIFYDDSDIDLICHQFMKDIMTIGETFMFDVVTYERVEQLIDTGHFGDMLRSMETRAIIDYYRGEKDKGLALLLSRQTRDARACSGVDPGPVTFVDRYRSLPDNPSELLVDVKLNY